MSEIIDGKWELVELLAVMWNPEMAQRFPNAEHHFCRQEMRHDETAPRCVGWHCNRCGAATNSYGHHKCPDRPEVSA